MAKKTSEQITSLSVDAGAVARRAYEIWQREGCPDGRAMEHWFQAEAELADHGNIASASDNAKPRGSRRSNVKVGERQFQMAGR